MATVTLPHNWRPRESQMQLWAYMENGGDRGLAVCHRRWGKDDVSLHYTATSIMKKPAVYWHMLPQASQARKAIWEAVNPHTGLRRIDEVFPNEIREATRENEMFIRFVNGATWQVVGSDNYDSLIGSPPYGLVLSEWSVADPEAWSKLSPILEENGGWAIFLYTPRGENHGKTFYDMAKKNPRWYCELARADETGVFSEEQLRLILQEHIDLYGETRGKSLFNQDYMCSFYEAFEGKPVYPDFNRKYHVADEPLLPYAVQGVKGGRSILRGWDNTGLSPACIICYQNTNGHLYVLKEFIGDDTSITNFTEQVVYWCNDVFGDADYRDIADPAGNIRDSHKKSPAIYMQEEFGIILENGVQTWKIRHDAVNKRLNKINGIFIDPSVGTLIKGFEGGYQHKEIGNTGTYHPQPDKNRYSHIHDGLQYLCTVIFREAGYRDDYSGHKPHRTGRNAHGGY